MRNGYENKVVINYRYGFNNTMMLNTYNVFLCIYQVVDENELNIIYMVYIGV